MFSRKAKTKSAWIDVHDQFDQTLNCIDEPVLPSVVVASVKFNYVLTDVSLATEAASIEER